MHHHIATSPRRVSAPLLARSPRIVTHHVSGRLQIIERRSDVLSLAALALLASLLCTVGCGGVVRSPDRGWYPPGAGAPPAGGQPDREVAAEELEGKATWYGEPFHGRKTANGEDFDMNLYTAAHRTLPFNTVVRVVDTKTLKSVVVRINDRGPFGKRARIIDLARTAALDLGILGRGVASVRLEIVSWGDGARYHHGRRTVPAPRATAPPAPTQPPPAPDADDADDASAETSTP